MTPINPTVIFIIILISGTLIALWIGLQIYKKIIGVKSPIELFKLSIRFPDLKIIKSILSEINFPYALDFVVENLGSDVSIYISVRDSNIQRLKQFFANKNISYQEFDDYLVMNSSGVWDALTARINKDDLLDFDFRSVNFSDINAVGEGAVLRIINSENNLFTIEIIASASADFPMREIRDTLASPFRNYGLEHPKNMSAFFKKFNSPNYL